MINKINKFLSILAIITLLFAPTYAHATGENEETTGGEQSTTTNQETGNGESNSNENGGDEPLEEAKITLDKTTLDLDAKETATLKATVTPADSEVVWSSDKEDIATVDQNGKVTALNKAGTVTITATIKGTDTKATCTVQVTRILGRDATLKSLTISNGTLDKSFDSKVFEYTITLDSKVNSLKFTSLDNDLSDENAGWQVTGNSNLKNGSVVQIIVTSEDKSDTNKVTNTYKLTVVKDTINLNLKSLKINGYALNETFDAEVLEYTANIPYEIETISVQAKAEDDDVEVKVSGITNLEVGENTVNIVVKDASGNSRTYQIVVTREEEVSIEEKPTSIITSSELGTSDEDNETSGTVIPNNSDSDDDDFLKYAIVSLACLILFAIGGIGIYFYLKTSPKRLKKELTWLDEDEKVDSSPIVEVEESLIIEKPIPTENQGNISEIMDEKLVETREFRRDDFEELKKPENLFNDSEDV